MQVERFRWHPGGVSWDVLRLDLLHPVVSGNKPFKLQPFLTQALAEKRIGLLTFGGPFSNHVHAIAYAAAQAGIRSMGLIRGERGAIPSPTLVDAASWGMELRFLTREDYRLQHRMTASDVMKRHPGWLMVPEGGHSAEGAMGARGILDTIDTRSYDRIVCACGTGTMAAGLRMAADRNTGVVGIPVLKGHQALLADIRGLMKDPDGSGSLELFEGYHFGGYARQTPELLDFMRRFHQAGGIPTDFVYTAKLMYAVDDLLRMGRFGKTERILAIHSGGLQGNRSLPPGTLPFS